MPHARARLTLHAVSAVVVAMAALLGRRGAAIAAYREFLSAAADIPEFAEQRSAARRLLARLSGPPAGAAPGGR